MLRELGKAPERGLLGHIMLTASPRTYYVVQYWESKEKLYAYAQAAGMLHRRAWAVFNRKEKAGKVKQHVGMKRGRYAKDRFAHRSAKAKVAEEAG